MWCSPSPTLSQMVPSVRQMPLVPAPAFGKLKKGSTKPYQDGWQPTEGSREPSRAAVAGEHVIAKALDM